ncbi:MAG: acyl--CoA ligase, partial [Proteobacteria bacterium]|nr:acyl--CoA ligase [Pseudomonadota bacterium]
MNVGKVLGETAQRFPHKTAVIFKDEKISFSDLDLMATRLANKLQGLDIKKGDRVAIVLPNSSQWVVAYFAMMKLGAISAPLDFRFKEEELFPILKDARVKAIVTTSLYESHDVFSKVESIKGIIMTGEEITDGMLSYEEVMKDESLSALVNVDVKEEEEAVYLYTSGTTGKPKGVVLTFANLSLFPEAMDEICKTSESDVIG